MGISCREERVDARCGLFFFSLESARAAERKRELRRAEARRSATATMAEQYQQWQFQPYYTAQGMYPVPGQMPGALSTNPMDPYRFAGGGQMASVTSQGLQSFPTKGGKGTSKKTKKTTAATGKAKPKGRPAAKKKPKKKAKKKQAQKLKAAAAKKKAQDAAKVKKLKAAAAKKKKKQKLKKKMLTKGGKKKKERDPDAPKRARTAFNFFLDSFREDYKREHPEAKGVVGVTKAGSEKWKAMNPEEKQPFEKRASVAREAYTKAKEEYESRGGNAMFKIKKGPPRPPTAYFMFLSAFRQDYKIRNPEVKGIKEMSREAGEKWRSMDQEDKEPYEMKAKAAKAEYNKLKAMTPEERVQATE